MISDMTGDSLIHSAIQTVGEIGNKMFICRNCTYDIFASVLFFANLAIKRMRIGARKSFEYDVERELSHSRDNGAVLKELINST